MSWYCLESQRILAQVATININKAMSDMRASSGTPARLVFVYASGKRRGQIGVIDRAIYGRPKPSYQSKSAKLVAAEYRKRASQQDKLHPMDRPMVRHGILPLTCLDTDSYKQVLISHVIGYNHLKVIH